MMKKKIAALGGFLFLTFGLILITFGWADEPPVSGMGTASDVSETSPSRGGDNRQAEWPVLLVVISLIPAFGGLYWRLSVLSKQRSKISVRSADGELELTNVVEAINEHYQKLEEQLCTQEHFSIELKRIKAKTNEGLQKVAEKVGDVSRRVDELNERLGALTQVNDKTQSNLERYQRGFDAHRVKEFQYDLFRLFDDARRAQSELLGSIEDLLGNHGIEAISDKLVLGDDGVKYAKFERVDTDEPNLDGKREIVQIGFWTQTGETPKVLRMATVRIYRYPEAAHPTVPAGHEAHQPERQI